MDRKTSKKLIYFTSSYPYGLGETWKSNELRFYSEYFGEITVVPNNYGGNLHSPQPLPPGIRCEKPLFESDKTPISKFSVLQLLDKHFLYYFQEFFRKRVFSSKQKFISWLNASIRIKNLLRHPLIRSIMEHPDKDTVLYFFWGKGSCDFLPFTKKEDFFKRIVRFHRYDLFEDQNGGYIPYRRQLLQSADIIAPSSDKGYAHIHGLYPDVKMDMRVIRLGVIGNGKVRGSTDGVLRILSCSYVVPVKRVHLIAEALTKLSIPVEWTHVGDGPLMNEVHEIAGRFGTNIKTNFPGMVDTSKLIEYYMELGQIDLFLNVSSSEGVPMSIMECLSLSIPVFATAVGGSGEIVDDTVGKAFSPDITPVELARCLEAFYKKPEDVKKAMRNAAVGRYLEKCNAEVLTRECADLLVN